MIRKLAVLGICGILWWVGVARGRGHQATDSTGASQAARFEITGVPADSYQTFRTGEYSELLARLKNRAEFTMTAVSPYDSPIEIREALIKGMDRSPDVAGSDDTEPPTFEPYVMSASMVVVNRTDKRITEALFEFVDSPTSDTFLMLMSSLPGDAWLEAGSTKQIKVDLMALPYNPSNLSVQVAEVVVEGGDKWGPGELTAPRPVHPRTSKNIGPVDTRPSILNRVRPNYSEEARRRHIIGSARLELKVGADGVPTVTDILSRLPAGLTRQAVRAASLMRFKPAMRNGAPVPCYTLIDVEFNLR
jgi:TonB family protein